MQSEGNLSAIGDKALFLISKERLYLEPHQIIWIAKKLRGFDREYCGDMS